MKKLIGMFLFVGLCMVCVSSLVTAADIASDTFDSVSSTTGIDGTDWGITTTYSGGEFTPSADIANKLRLLSDGTLTAGTYWMKAVIKHPTDGGVNNAHFLGIQDLWGGGIIMGYDRWDDTFSIRFNTNVIFTAVGFDADSHTMIAKLVLTDVTNGFVSAWIDPDFGQEEGLNDSAKFVTNAVYAESTYSIKYVKVTYDVGSGGSFDEFLLSDVSPFPAPLPPAIVYSTNTFHEATVSDGTIDTEIIIDAVGGVNFSNTFSTADVTVNNLPSNLSAVFTYSNSTRVVASLTGSADNHLAINSITDLTFVFKDSAFTNNDASAVGDSSNGVLRIDFTDSQPDPVLTYTGTTFAESASNDGSITDTFTIDVAHDYFVGAISSDFVALGYVAVSNVPGGLTVVLTKADTNTLTASMTGNASAHNASDGISDLEFHFKDASLVGGSATNLTNGRKTDLSVTFDNPELAWSGSFVEAFANDGSIDSSSTVTATLTGDVFAGTAGSAITAFTQASIPLGLTAVVTKTSDTVATVTLTGNADSHAAIDNASDLEIAFGDAAFTASTAIVVTNATKSDIAVSFDDPGVVYYVSETGDDANDGLATGTPLATITNAVAKSVDGGVIEIMSGTLTESSIVINGMRLTIRGQSAGTTTIQAAATKGTAGNRIFTLEGVCTVLFEDLTLKNGAVEGNGGAIDDPMVGYKDTYITVRRCVFIDNVATNGSGGAIAVYSGTLSVEDSLFADNELLGETSQSRGGAVWSATSVVMIRNTTFSRNIIIAGGNYVGGAAIYAPAGGRIHNCTFYGNETEGPFAEAAIRGIAGMAVESCLFASNTINGVVTSADIVYGTVFNTLYESTKDVTDLGGNIQTNNAGISVTLADNGGATMTHALLPGSPAIDAGSNPDDLANDQRGVKYARVFGAAADCGAFEYGAGPAVGWAIFIW